MADLSYNLEKEIRKWLPKVKEELKKIRQAEDKDFLINVKAYIEDAEYFLKKNDLIHSFEAVIWSWAWLEIGKSKKILK